MRFCNQNVRRTWPGISSRKAGAMAPRSTIDVGRAVKCHHRALLVVAALAAVSCSSSLSVPSPGPELSPAREATAAPRPARRVAEARRIRVPSSAPWLTERLVAEYTAAPASAVLSMIAQDHPVRLVFQPDVDPLVRRSPSAVTIHDHLASVCSQADWTYTVAEGTVLVSDIETAVFPLSQPPGQTKVEAPLRGLATSDAEGGAQSVTNVDLDPYGLEVVQLVKSVLGIADEGGAGEVAAAAPAAAGETAPGRQGSPGRGGATVDPRTAVAVVPSANSVVVTARPHKIREVRRVLRAMNAAVGQTVRIHLAIYEVDVTDTETRSLDLMALRHSAAQWGISVAPPEGTDGSLSSLSVELGSGGTWDGATAVFQWLGTAGRTTTLFEDTVEARANQVATVDTTRTRQYVKSIAREAQSTGSAILESPNVTIDELRTGWVVHVQPSIAGDRITLRMVLSRASLVDEVPYSFDGGRIAGTNFVTDESNRALFVELRDGETKVVTQLASKEEQVTERRTPWLPWIGDGVVRAERARETVMTVTARVI